MARCEHCGSAVALGEAACPVCHTTTWGTPPVVGAWVPPDDVGKVQFSSSATWTAPEQYPGPAVEAAIWRVRVALGAVLLIASGNLGLALFFQQIGNFPAAVVFGVLSVFIRRKSLVALIIAAGYHAAASGRLVLTHQITWTFAIGFRVLVLFLILQAIGPVQLLRSRERNAVLRSGRADRNG